MDNKDRYEQFLKIVREAEFTWNVEPDDLEVCAAFLMARAKVKKMMREAIEPAMDIDYGEVPDVA